MENICLGVSAVCTIVSAGQLAFAFMRREPLPGVAGSAVSIGPYKVLDQRQRAMAMLAIAEIME